MESRQYNSRMGNAEFKFVNVTRNMESRQHNFKMQNSEQNIGMIA